MISRFIYLPEMNYLSSYLDSNFGTVPIRIQKAKITTLWPERPAYLDYLAFLGRLGQFVVGSLAEDRSRREGWALKFLGSG